MTKLSVICGEDHFFNLKSQLARQVDLSSEAGHGVAVEGDGVADLHYLDPGLGDGDNDGRVSGRGQGQATTTYTT